MTERCPAVRGCFGCCCLQKRLLQVRSLQHGDRSFARRRCRALSSNLPQPLPTGTVRGAGVGSTMEGRALKGGSRPSATRRSGPVTPIAGAAMRRTLKLCVPSQDLTRPARISRSVLWMRRNSSFKNPPIWRSPWIEARSAIQPPARPEEFEPALAHHAFLSCPGTTRVQNHQPGSASANYSQLAFSSYLVKWFAPYRLDVNSVVNGLPPIPWAKAGDSSTGVHRSTASIAAATNCCCTFSSPATLIFVTCGGPIRNPSLLKLKLSVTVEFLTPAGGFQHDMTAAPTSSIVVRRSA